MEEILIVDRIENGYAVCETEQGEKKDIPLSETKDVHEGDVLISVSYTHLTLPTTSRV